MTPEEKKIYKKEWKLKNPEKHKEHQKRYYSKPSSRIKIRKNQLRHYYRHREELLMAKKLCMKVTEYRKLDLS